MDDTQQWYCRTLCYKEGLTSGTADSKTLMLRAIDKHYPHLTDKYQQLFSNSNELPAYYREAFGKKAKELCLQYGIDDRII